MSEDDIDQCWPSDDWISMTAQSFSDVVGLHRTQNEQTPSPPLQLRRDRDYLRTDFLAERRHVMEQWAHHVTGGGLLSSLAS